MIILLASVSAWSMEINREAVRESERRGRRMLPEIHEDTRRGTYALILRALERRRIRIGRFGWLTAREGYYVYVGSAFGAGGLGGRLRHHLHPARASHWHIDFLRKAPAPIEVRG